MMKKIYTFIFAFFLTCNLNSQDTFSIIAVDSLTGEVGAAGATCVDGIAQWGGIQLLNKIIPGKGGVNAQAWICISPHINLDNAIGQMNAGLSPQEIIDWLQLNDACNSQNFNPEYRQYGIVDFDANGTPRVAAFTGANADDFKGHRTGLDYSIQGNILLGPEVLDGLENGFNNTAGTLAEKLMGAMQGANIPGADQRCLDRGTSSTSAFLRVYQADDMIGDPYLELSIWEMPFGEEPIDSLQNLFDSWLITSAKSVFMEKNIQVSLSPNPVNELLQIGFKLSHPTELELNIFNLAGRNLFQTSINASDGFIKKINTENFPKGFYFLQIKTKSSETKIFKFTKV